MSRSRLLVRRLSYAAAVAWLTLCGEVASFAAVVPEGVAVVVNGDSEASRRVADEYARLRQIPAANLVTVQGLSNVERIGVVEFREKILKPVLATLDERGLRPQIEAVVYSCEIPTAIDVRADVGTQRLPQIFTPEASVNGLTYLYQAVLEKDIRYLDMNVNRYARRMARAGQDGEWSTDDRQLYSGASRQLDAITRARFQRAQRRERATAELAAAKKAAEQKAVDSKPADGGKKEDEKEEKKDEAKQREKDSKESKSEAELAAAVEKAAAELKKIQDADDIERKAEDEGLVAALTLMEQLRVAHPKSAELVYNLACAEAQLGRLDAALKSLGAAVDNGWFDVRHTQNDPDFRELRGRPEFAKLLERMKTVEFTMQPPLSFSAASGWSEEGEPVAAGAGPRYLLSTVLGVTTGRGLSVDETIENLKRSSGADGTRPAGTVYFPTNGDIRSTTREWAFKQAAAELQKLGVAAVVEPGVLPRQKGDVAGAVIGIADFDWPASGSKILPGAIVEHLTSFGGVMTRGAGQTPLTEFLRNGAAGASGTVTEPYAIQAKFPTAFIQVAYAKGLSLAESFYLSVSGPYQLLIVGDPLCRPWAEKVELQLAGLSAENEPSRGTLALTPQSRTARGVEAKSFELYVDGVRRQTIAAGERFTLDTGKLPAGKHSLTVVSLTGSRIETIGRRSWTIFVAN